MSDDGKCPRCAFKAPVICFMDAAENGQLFQLYAQMAHEVQKPYLKYLSLFRPASGCAIQASKVDRLTREFVGLINTGYVHEKGKVDRPCPPHIWAMGMERMQEQAASLTLPMKSHNYLRAIVWQLADQADAQQEQKVRQGELTGGKRSHAEHGNEGADGMSEVMRKYLEINGGDHAE